MTRAIVFARTKRGADRIAEKFSASRRHPGGRDPRQQGAGRAPAGARRTSATGRARVLVATDIAARGIDVKDISHVVNYDLPDEPEAYVHRIGRTGRNGAEGIAVAFCAPDERDKLRAVEKVTRRRLLPEGAGPARDAKAGPAPARKPKPAHAAQAKGESAEGQGARRRPRRRGQRRAAA